MTVSLAAGLLIGSLALAALALWRLKEDPFRVNARSAPGANRSDAMLAAHGRIEMREREYQLMLAEAKADAKRALVRGSVVSIRAYAEAARMSGDERK
jgi:hypothetical protein